MRSTTVKVLDDKTYIDLGSNTDYVCAVMEIGKCTDYLIYEAELTGAELLEFLKKICPRKDFSAQITPENRYSVTAYDW